MANGWAHKYLVGLKTRGGLQSGILRYIAIINYLCCRNKINFIPMQFRNKTPQIAANEELSAKTA